MVINIDYVLMILNCNQYKYKADFQKQTWLKILPKNIIYFHVIGLPELKDQYQFDISNNLLYVRNEDDYISLPSKTINAINAINNTYAYKYILKTDDDQTLIDNNFFNNLFNTLDNNKLHYGGHIINCVENISKYNTIHKELPADILLKACLYSSGRFYFLSKEVVPFLLFKKQLIYKHFFEDHAIGYYLSDFPLLRILSLDISKIFVDTTTYINSKYHIYTECIGCPEIGINAIKSFIKYHPDIQLHAYVDNKDIPYIKGDNNIDLKQIILVETNESLLHQYQQNGHLATAILWANIINNNKNKYIIHIDSDTWFRGNLIYDIINYMENGYDLVGPVRCYKNNLNNRKDLGHLKDVVSTYCFGFNPLKIDNFEINLFINMIRGFTNPLNHPILDFFDPVSFNILKNNGKIKFIDYNIIGGLNELGSKRNNNDFNKLFDVGDKIVHFSAVGSGLTYRKSQLLKKHSNIPISYLNAGLKSLGIYEYIFNDIESIYVDDTIRQFKKTILNL
jgi:hypothetical protein